MRNNKTALADKKVIFYLAITMLLVCAFFVFTAAFSASETQSHSYTTLGSIVSDNVIYSCYPSCVAYINVTVTNETINGSKWVTINNTADAGIISYKISWYNSSAGSNVWESISQSNVSLTDFNLSYYTDGNNQFMVNITLSEPVSAKWNFSIGVNGTYFVLDPHLDSINLTLPLNGSTITDSTPDFKFVLYSNNQTTQTCSLIINGSTRASNSSVSNGSLTTFPAITMSDGDYVWNVSCENTGTSIQHIMTIAEPPSLVLNAPVDGYNSSSRNVTFRFTVRNGGDTSFWCNLTINDSVNMSLVAVTDGVLFSNTTTLPSDGSYNWNVTCWDISNNKNFSATRTLVVDTVYPTFSIKPVESVNVTTTVPSFGVNITEALSGMKTAVYTTSCDGTQHTLSNNTVFYPFNKTGCIGTAAARNLTLVITDHAGNANTTILTFNVDDVAPAFSSRAFANNNSAADINISYAVADGLTGISEVGYYLDGLPTYHNLSVTSSGAIAVSFTAGRHAIKLTANDTAGNRRNDSAYIITATKNFNMTLMEENFIRRGGFRDIVVRLTNGTELNQNQNVSQSFDVMFVVNTTLTSDINVTFAGFEGISANWDHNFTILSNLTSRWNGIMGNWSGRVTHLAYLNSSADTFLPEANDHYGTVTLPFNASKSGLFVYWFENEDDISLNTTVRACTGAGFSTAYTKTATTPCYNVTAAEKTTVYVPHFSMVAAVNDSVAPHVIINKPGTLQSESTFYLNVTTSLDAISCNFSVIYNTSESRALNLVNATNTSGILETIGGVKYCTYLDSFKNSNYTFSVTVTDSAGNRNTTLLLFEVNDTTDPLIDFNSTGNVTLGTITAVITWTSNEYVNATISYGTTTALGTNSNDATFDSYAPLFTLSALTQSTNYYYNITSCDYAGNCVVNGTYTFATLAPTNTSTATTTSSGGGGVFSTDTTSDVIATISKQWATVTAGEEVKLNVIDSNIAVRAVVFTTSSDYSNVGMDVSSIYKPSSLSEPASKLVYQYLDIDSSNLPVSGIDSAKIQFRIPYTWFNENNIRRGTVKLLRYSNGWKTLDTEEIKSDNTYAYYEATTPGFSYFAITGEETSSDTDEEKAAEDKGEEAAEGAAETSQGEEGVIVEKKSLSWIWWVLGAIIVLGLAVYFFMTGKTDRPRIKIESTKEKRKR